MTKAPVATPSTDAIRAFIVRAVDTSDGKGIASQVARHFGITRQGAHWHLQQMVADHVLTASGQTRNRVYRLAVLGRVDRTLSLTGLEEGEVWRAHLFEFMQSVPGKAHPIAQYAVTEMLNNAIDHSAGMSVRVAAWHTARRVHFLIHDDGIGIFRRIARALELPTEVQAVLELSKGKLTTDPARHTGHGVFFTSRACDTMSIESGRIALYHTESGRDIVFEVKPELPEVQGTKITMSVRVDTRRTMIELYKQFEDKDVPGFSKTIIPVSMAELGDDNLISRSQAKRVLARVERFAQVVLDFTNVDHVGQAFADEIFRVFQLQHPEVTLVESNANPGVQKMIDLARAELAGRAEPSGDQLSLLDPSKEG